MRIFLLIIAFSAVADYAVCQGITKSGQNTESSSDFVDKNGRIKNTADLNKYGQILRIPSLSTTAITSITSNGATSGGNITDNGGATILARGVCWNTSGIPTTVNDKTNDGQGTGTFTSLLTGLTPSATYFLRAYATNSSGTAYGNEVSFTTTGYYSHTITIDGINDFVAADEQFGTGSAGYNAWFAWDANYFYIGYKGPDINSMSTSKWLVIYMDGSPGIIAGITLNTQTPSLPFDAKYCIHWKTSNDYFGVREYNGSAWTASSFVTASDYNKSNDYIEMRIPRSSVGNPSKLKVHVNMVNEYPGNEWTYGGVPATSFSDGYDPDFLHYFQFDFSGTIKPKDYLPQ